MRVLLAHKNFAANKQISHIGLGVAAINTALTLQDHGISAMTMPIIDSNQLRQEIRLNKNVTHVVISAPWIMNIHMRTLCQTFPKIKFAMNCHSNVAFLQADPNGTKILRENLELSKEFKNFKVSANSVKMAKWVTEAYGVHCEYLPNLYYIPKFHQVHKPHHHHQHLNIGVFGAIRPQKNVISAIAASIVLANRLRKKVRVHLSTGRIEGGSQTMMRTITEMCANLPQIELVPSGWAAWPEFRHLVKQMHLLIQPSYTESFNMVTADGIYEGIPSVVGEAIHWAPSDWIANVDDICEIADVGERLLSGDHSEDGLHSLKKYVKIGIKSWEKFISGR